MGRGGGGGDGQKESQPGTQAASQPGSRRDVSSAHLGALAEDEGQLHLLEEPRRVLGVHDLLRGAYVRFVSLVCYVLARS